MEYKDYLDSLTPNEREYVANFFRRKEYIEKLNETAIDNCEGVVLSSKGNCNSKIAVVINHHKNLETVIRFIKPMFESINTSLWNIYITCINKADDGDSNIWNQMVQHELNAVSPSFVFKFGENVQSFIKKDIIIFGKTFPVVFVNIDDVNYVLNKDNFKTERYIQIMNDFYKYVLEIIQYREIEIAE